MVKNKKAKNRNQNNSIKINREAAALLFALAAFLSAYVFLVQDKSGMFGRAFSKALIEIFGVASYILPLILLWYFVIHIRQSVKIRGRIDFIWSILCMISSSILFSAIHSIFESKVFGGWIGDKLYPFFKELFGIKLSFAVIVTITLIFIAKLLRISIALSVYNFLKKLREVMTSSKKIKIQNDIQKIVAQQKNESDFFKQEPIKPNIVSKQEGEEKKRKVALLQSVVKQQTVASSDFSYKLPHVDLLKNDATSVFVTNKDDLLKRADLLRTTLADFDIIAEVKDIIPGPVVTRYDLVLSPGTRIQAVSSVIDNLSLAMRTASIRVVPIPEKAVVGIEVPNPSSTIVGLRGVLESGSFKNSHSLLTLALGKTTDGLGYATSLASMPHLLIAGATGSGK
ncbi:DNA translocase FtsK 4TM domain-containing protein, partial [Candidatus Endomicrobiellum pyrsonymphae]|uniref:DNA translocase FtsK 4TM domain-containing protein n=1 Tax=Candidatus Endomicrobiellum pyrsonymphae TaxID=1408203 RepID=UPI0035A98084